MKKIVFLVSLMCATMAMAAPTITATSQIDLSTAGQTDKYVRFVLSNSFSNGFDNTWDTPAPNESGIYVYYNNERYTGWASNEYSENLPLGFYTCENSAYTLKFSNFSGATYSIYDRVADYTITVNGSTPNYDFTIDDSEKSSQINDRFIINYNPAAFAASVTTGADGWASFAYSADVAPAYPAGLIIYKGAFNDDLDNPAIALTPVADIPAGAGVFVKGEANTTYYFAAATAAADMSDNDIVGCVDATSVSSAAFSGKDIYTLRYANGETALWHYTGSADIPAGKAVLPISVGGGAPAPKRVALHFGETTAVENVEAAAPVEKIIENGQVLIKRGENVYTLQGQIVK